LLKTFILVRNGWESDNQSLMNNVPWAQDIRAIIHVAGRLSSTGGSNLT
jgi:hypothetical protein